MSTKWATINTDNGPAPVALTAGSPLILAGPNGVGKSSLLHAIARGSGTFLEHYEILAGFRQISFSNGDVESSGIPLSDLSAQLSHENIHNNRYRNHLSDPHLKSVIKRFISTHNQNNEDLIREAANREENIQTLDKYSNRAIPMLNSIFRSARMPVELTLESGQLQAHRGGITYSIDRMSDGERAALLLIGSILIRPPGTLLAIDEPERHLSRSNSGPLIAAAVRARPDLFYVIATHDLSLCEWLPNKTIIHVRDSFTSDGDNAETRTYAINIISQNDELSEELQISLLGARKETLLVEGDVNSSDRALYSNIYPNHSILPAAGWETLTNSVKALRGNKHHHHLEVWGLIDGDGRDEAEVAALAVNGTFVLPVPTVENLFFHSSILAEMASAIFSLKGGQSADIRVNLAETEAAIFIKRHVDDIARRRVVWRVARALSARKISVKELAQSVKEVPAIDVEAMLVEERFRLTTATEQMKPSQLLWNTPIKNTGVPDAVAKAIGFDNFADYRTAVLRQMEAGTPAGLRMLKDLRDQLPCIPAG